MENSKSNLYWNHVKNWIYMTNLSYEMKEYLYLYLFHDIKNKKKLKVVARDLKKENMILPVFIDIETPCVFHQKTGNYIGIIKNGEIKIVNN